MLLLLLLLDQPPDKVVEKSSCQDSGVALDETGKVLTGSSGGEPVIIITLLNDAGDYKVELKGPIDHTYGDNVEGSKTFGLTVNVTDGIATDSGILSITI